MYLNSSRGNRDPGGGQGPTVGFQMSRKENKGSNEGIGVDIQISLRPIGILEVLNGKERLRNKEERRQGKELWKFSRSSIVPLHDDGAIAEAILKHKMR